jgi:micrococcal nuclease
VLRARSQAYTKQLLEGQTVLLEKDVSETDHFGRLLRYVYLENGKMVNELLVRDGYAQVSTFPPDVNYQERFLAAQQQAVASGAGLFCLYRSRADGDSGVGSGRPDCDTGSGAA